MKTTLTFLQKRGRTRACAVSVRQWFYKDACKNRRGIKGYTFGGQRNWEIEKFFKTFLVLFNCLSCTCNTYFIDYNFKKLRKFPGSPVVKTERFHCWDLGSIPGQRNKILTAEQYGQKLKYFKLKIF